MSREFYLDCRPMKEPVNPFTHMAKQLRAMRYADRPTMERAAQIVAWYESLAAQLPDVVTEDPVLSAAIAKAAVSAPARNILTGALLKIESILQKYPQPQPQPQDETGFKIPD